MSLSEFLDINNIVTRAIITLFIISLSTAPIGCFLVWRKMSYFGATLSHSALLGAVIGILTGVGVVVGVISFTVILALFLGFLLQQRYLAADTLLGIMAHFTLAVGVIIISSLDKLRIDLMAYLFGDVLAISNSLLIYLVLFSGLVLVVLFSFWRGFVTVTINQDIAQAEGYSVKKLEIAFILCLAFTISLGMFAVGVLLIVAMLIIPAATARAFSKSMLSMIFISFLITLINSVVGVALAFGFDFPIGASIVTVSGLVFALSRIVIRLLTI